MCDENGTYYRHDFQFCVEQSIYSSIVQIEKLCVFLFVIDEMKNPLVLGVNV